MRLEKYIEEGLGSFKKAYFISPYGKIIDCNTTHIQEIIKNPKLFGYTKEKIKQMHDKYDEMVGQEGKARGDIIRDLISKGWIRLRKYKNYWVINVNKLTKKVKDYLQEWADKVQDNLYGFRERDKFIPVQIEGSNFRIEHTLKDISSDILYNESEKKEQRHELIIEEKDEI